MSKDPTAIPIELDPREQRMVGTAIHGNTPFDVPYMSKLDDNLWQGGCADGLILPPSIDKVLSLYPWERYQIERDDVERIEFKMFDSLDQAFDQVEYYAHVVNNWRNQGYNVLVHCQAGLNRSSLVAARALMLDGMTADEAIDRIRSKRSPACLCNKSFEQYLRGIES